MCGLTLTGGIIIPTTRVKARFSRRNIIQLNTALHDTQERSYTHSCTRPKTITVWFSLLEQKCVGENPRGCIMKIRETHLVWWCSVRDKVNVASLLMIILMTKMEYCTDILR